MVVAVHCAVWSDQVVLRVGYLSVDTRYGEGSGTGFSGYWTVDGNRLGCLERSKLVSIQLKQREDHGAASRPAMGTP